MLNTNTFPASPRYLVSPRGLRAEHAGGGERLRERVRPQVQAGREPGRLALVGIGHRGQDIGRGQAGPLQRAQLAGVDPQRSGPLPRSVP